MHSKKTYVVIPVHNRKEMTIGCLNNLDDLGLIEKYTIVVVDDDSTDGTAEAISQNFPSVTLLKGVSDLWWTGAIKLGMEYAFQRDAEYIVWLNDDCYLEENAIGLMIQSATEKNAVVGAQGFRFDKTTILSFGGKRITWRGLRFIRDVKREIRPCDLLSGNLVCLPRQIIASVGYPDPLIAPHYGGDSLYLTRVRKAGYKLFVDGRCAVFDKGIQESRLYPTSWLLGDDPFQLIRLTLTPQSGLSWRVWLHLNWQTYGYWGIVMLFKKYFSILLFTVARLLSPLLRFTFIGFIFSTFRKDAA